MTLVSEPSTLGGATPPEREPGPRGSLLTNLATTTDHKTIGLMYIVTSFGFFMLAGLLAEVMRAELARPGLQFLSNEQYNQLFTMHGTIMLLFFATSIAIGFANYVVPLQIGAPDMAFPRLNALGYWLYLFGGLTAVGGFLAPGGAAAFGWFAYSPLSSAIHSPGIGADLWIVGLAVSGFGTILGGVNFITTIITMRAPGMTMFRMPIFTWNMLITSILILMAFPVLAAALLVLLADRQLGAQIFEAETGGAILWQHLFWFFGHPEVYIVALPFFGMVSEIIPVFSRKPLFGYKGLVFATISIAALSMTVWAHHMFVTGAVLLPFFSFMSFLIAVPTGVKFFNWIGTMFRGSISFETPMLFSIGFLATFLLGGLTGVLLASPPIDFHVSDTYFVVAHFHYVLYGTVVFASFAATYFWFPQVHGALPGRAARQDPLLADRGGLQPDVPRAALARRGGHAAALRRLPGQRRLHRPEHGVEHRRLRARRLDAAVPVQPVHQPEARRAGRRRRPLGPRQQPGVGHLVPAAAAQLPVDAAHPFGATGVRPALPAARRAHRPARHARAGLTRPPGGASSDVVPPPPPAGPAGQAGGRAPSPPPS